MSVSFNVLDAPWIPVVDFDGNRLLLGIRETLRRAPELKEISVVSPLEEFSVYRFLSVFLMDALRPEDRENIEELLDEGNFDMEQIGEYISLCEEEGVSFDLFDEKRPFMQAAYVKEWDKESESISRLDFTHPNGNNHVHFEHGSKEIVKFTYAEAFRKLLSNYVFATQGGSGYSPSINGTPPYMILVNGENLFDTLCFQMVPLGEHDTSEECPAIWTKDSISPKKEFTTVGFFRGMFFPVRRICLIPEEKCNAVSSVYYNPGYKFSGGDGWTDTSVAYARKKEGKRYPLRPNLGVGIWRNYSELVRKSGRPEVITRYCKYDLGWDHATITLYGLQADKATCENIFRHSIRIPQQILSDEDKAEVLEVCIADADSLGNHLSQALRKVLQHEKENSSNKQSKKPSKPNAKVKESVNTYFAKCERVFWGFVEDVATRKQEEMTSVISEWKKQISDFAANEFNSVISCIHARGKVLRQIADAEKDLNNWILLLQRRNVE